MQIANLLPWPHADHVHHADRAEHASRQPSFFELLHESYDAFGRYEKLRQLSDDALRKKGLPRTDAARQLFFGIYEKN